MGTVRNQGQPEIRMIDIAREAGVSRPVVSAVLTGAGNGRIQASRETAERIRAIAAKYHFQPNAAARMLRGKSGKLIGILIDSIAPLVHFSLVGCIEKQASQSGYHIQIAESHDDPASLFDAYLHMKRHGVDGVICISHDYPGNDRKTEELFRGCHDVIFISGPVMPGHSHVIPDIAAGYAQAAELLKKNGCRSPVMIVPNTPATFTIRQRIVSFRKVYPQGRIEEIDPKTADPAVLRQEVRCMTDRLLSGESRADSILASNDLYAQMVISELIRRGIRVPEDVEVIGCDNEPFTEWSTPAITTVDQNSMETARESVNLLLSNLQNPDSRTVYIAPRLVIRNSTKGKKI